MKVIVEVVVVMVVVVGHGRRGLSWLFVVARVGFYVCLTRTFFLM